MKLEEIKCHACHHTHKHGMYCGVYYKNIINHQMEDCSCGLDFKDSRMKEAVKEVIKNIEQYNKEELEIKEKYNLK